jgi:hypothetical protein
MSQEELIATVEHMANLFADIDATCTRHALPGEFTIIDDCGCCGAEQWSHHKLTPHKDGCPIDAGLQFCRNGFQP